MRIDLKEKNHFLTVFETFFEQSIDRPINGISIDSRNIKKMIYLLLLKEKTLMAMILLIKLYKMVQVIRYHHIKMKVAIIFLLRI